MIFAIAAWVWAGVGPWFWWLWGPVILAMNGVLKMCGVVLLYERGLRWLNGVE